MPVVVLLLLLLVFFRITSVRGATTPHLWDWEDTAVVDPYTSEHLLTFKAVAVAFDSKNDVFIGGRSSEGMFAVKLDGASGTVLWTYLQEDDTSTGSAANLVEDLSTSGTVDAAGNFIMAGDFAAKIDGATGEEIWLYNNETEVVNDQYDPDEFPSWLGTAVDATGDVYLVTYIPVSAPGLSSQASMFATKLDGDSGEYMWSWGEDTPAEEYLTGVVADGDNNVLLLGHAEGQFVYDGPFNSMVGIQLQANSGEEQSRWQQEEEYGFQELSPQLLLGGIDGDGYVVLGGGVPGVDDTLAISADFGVVKLHATTGAEQWRWVDGTPDREYATAGVVDDNDDVIIFGMTDGGFVKESSTLDYVAVKLDGSTGAELWRWQDGSIYDDFILGAAIDADGMLVIVATSDGTMSVFKLDPADMAAEAATAPPSNPQPTTQPTPQPVESDGASTDETRGSPAPSATAATSPDEVESEGSSLASATTPTMWILLAWWVAITGHLV
eukprot:g6298.t1